MLALVTVVVPVVHGQAAEGTILGTVRDESGGAVPGVSVKVTHTGTALSRTVETDSVGSYRVPNLPIGLYQIEAELVGFRRHAVQAVRLSIGENVRVDLTMRVGELAEQVTVTGSVETIRTDSAELAYQVGQQQLTELPLNGRMYLSLAHVIPGANAGLRDRRKDTWGAGLVVAGARSEANNFLIDGISNNEERTGGFVVAPSVDAIQEFKVQTSQYSAEYGRAGGAVVNVSIRSGSNAFHGSAYEFHRNNALDARNFFDPRPLPYIRNQFGGTFGGPVRRDHTFYFLNYEGTRIRQSVTRFGNVPDPAWLTGDFSRAPFLVYDPATNRPNPANPSQIIRTAFEGNVIPAARVDPTGRSIAQSYAAPNYAQPGSTFNFQSTNSRPNDQDQFNARLDHKLGAHDQLFGRISFTNTDQFDGGLGAFPQSDGSIFKNRGLQIAIAQTHIFGPNLLNEVRLGYASLQTEIVQADQGGTLGSALGIPGLNPTPFESGFPNVSVRNLSGTDHPVGFGLGLPTEERDRSFQLIETMSLKSGRHGLKFGADIQRVHFSAVTGSVGGASFSFDGRYTSAVGGQLGNGIADLLLGTPNTISISRTFDLARYRFWNFHFFVNDDWQISSNWTVNLGLRYEVQTPVKEIYGREAYVDVATGQVRLHQDGIPWLESVIGVKASDLPFPVRIEDNQSFYSADKNNFAPRIGLAWRPFGSNHTAFRLGAGTFFVSGIANITTNGGLNPPFRFSQTAPADPNIPTLSLSQGVPATSIDALRIPGFQNFGLEDWKIGYYNKWSLSIQHQLTDRMIIESAYMGHTAPNLYVNWRENRPLPGSGNIQARRPYPLIGALSQFGPVNTSTYHGWLNQIRVTEWKGITFQANYTFSRTMDNQSAFGGAGDGKAGLIGYHSVPGYGVKADKARSSLDGRHRYAQTFIYQTPRLGDWNPTGRYLLGDWQISGLITLQTGFPYQVNLADDVANIGDTAGFRPNRVCDGNLASSQRTVERWFDTTCFTVPAQFTFGNSGRNVLDGDGITYVDFALMKNIPLRAIGESHMLQFRAEFFNLFNNVNFDRPQQNIARPGFGAITATAVDARQIQFGLKYVF